MLARCKKLGLFFKIKAMNKTFVNLLTGIIFFAAANFSFAQNNENTYRYAINLSKAEDDKLEVILTTPKISEKEITFMMPKMVPGTYKVYDFGRFIEKFNAYDKDNNALKVVQKNKNEWQISDADKLTKITYWVNDTFDDEDGSNFVFEPAGTNIEAGRNYVINTHGFFGYFEGKTNLPYAIEVNKPSFLFGATSMINKEKSNERDLFVADNYHDLVDAPIMYTEPDTAVFTIGGAEILISVHSPSKKLSAKSVQSKIKTILEAQKNYMGGTLPIKKYAFVIYLFKGMFSRSGSYGALEHSYSSFYFLPEASGEGLTQTIIDVSAHEFFHIITPLNIHSEEIHYFDFNKPTMSKHLWLYEGITEYFANHVQLNQKLYDQGTFFKNMSEKINSSRSNFTDNLSFTQMSKGALGEFENQYGNVYEKGALIGLCLDARLRVLSKGEMGLMDLIRKLSQKYGKSLPFKDDELFGVITAMTYPEIGDFFKKYVEGSEPLPFKEFFAPLGVNYEDVMETENFTFGNISVNLNEDKNRYFIAGLWMLNKAEEKIGFKEKDLILEVNKMDFTPQNAGEVLMKMDKLRNGEKITYTVEREEKGKVKKVILKAKIQKEKSQKRFYFKPMDNPSAEQIRLFNAWAFGATK